MMPTPPTTLSFSAFDASESVANLHLALDSSGLVQQINDLKNESWRGKPFEVSLCGDYEILRKFLGLQGASATYPCTHCLVHKNDLNKDITSTPRTIDQIVSDFEKVESQGFKSSAKRENNSISHKPFFNIPINKVCPPALHISLGIWQKFFTLLERDLQELGEAIADDLAEKESSSSSSSSVTCEAFDTYVQSIKQIKQGIRVKRDNADNLRSEALDIEFEMMSQSLLAPQEPDMEQMKEVEELHRRASNLEKEADLLRSKYSLEEFQNPLLTKLDVTLKEFKVRRQAYFGRTFCGNHVDKCLKPENYTRLLESVVEETRKLDSDMEDRASIIQMKYLVLFEHFSKCHRHYSHARPVTTQDIDTLERGIKDLMDHFLKKFPNVRITPKMHLLWKHVPCFMKETMHGLGRYGEQGGEQQHKIFNELTRRLQGIQRGQKEPELQLLLSVMEEHIIITHPDIHVNFMEE
ncbi:uncharacterized protein [Amphiura filiformis]|uniref:uncharacterized protein n=1 Tax=Amphiura filiformis TaxID=82378 RepID=UPI003B228AF6